MDGSDYKVLLVLQDVLKKDPGRVHPLFNRHGVGPAAGVKALVDEIRLDGSNSFASLFRWHTGVEYSEIVRDVADKLDVKSEGDEVTTEMSIVAKVMADFYKNCTPDERAEIDTVLEKQRAAATRSGVKWGVGEVVGAAVWAAVLRQAGATAVKQIVRKLVTMQSSRFAAIFAARRAASLATSVIPFVNVAMAAWTAWDLAGPAYRKTIPTVIEIALLRMEHA